MEKCRVEKCDRDCLARNYCSKHYLRVKKYGSPHFLKTKTNCKIKKCSNKHYGIGLCKYHYMYLFNKTKNAKEAKIQWKIDNKDKVVNYRRLYQGRSNELKNKQYYKLRYEILLNYGNKCQCCNEKTVKFLSLDHKNDDGHQHRRQFSSSIMFYKWIIDNKYPDSLQILCHNCNHGRYLNGGTCPHND